MNNKIYKIYLYIYVQNHNLGYVEILSENAINSQLTLWRLTTHIGVVPHP